MADFTCLGLLSVLVYNVERSKMFLDLHYEIVKRMSELARENPLLGKWSKKHRYAPFDLIERHKEGTETCRKMRLWVIVHKWLW